MKLLNRLFVSIMLCFMLLNLSGCGQKGPLYLPDDHPEKEPEKRQKRNKPYF